MRRRPYEIIADSEDTLPDQWAGIRTVTLARRTHPDCPPTSCRGWKERLNVTFLILDSGVVSHAVGNGDRHGYGDAVVAGGFAGGIDGDKGGIR